MLKIILITNDTDNKASKKIVAMPGIEVIATIPAAEFSATKQSQYDTDLIIMDNAAANYFFQNNSRTKSRKNVFSKTHQGIQTLAVENIFYFLAEHKYVTAYHTQGQLLIDDSLDSLEKDLTNTFIRVHRKVLAAKDQIEQLIKEPSGQHKIKLRNVQELLPVSRRKLAQVRKLLICK